MSKFKIIEKSRFLNNTEMGDVKGGTTICSAESAYNTCTGGKNYKSCQPSSVVGYNINNCVKLHFTCGSDMDYGVSYCWGLGWFSESCPGGTNWSN